MKHSSLTPRALISGVLLGALLTPCNIYSGLKIGWSFNVSILALLVASAFWALPAAGKLAGYSAVTAKNLTFTLDPSLMLLGFGAIIGFRAGVSLVLGAILSWALLGPWGLTQGFISPGADDPAASWFASMIEWLLWPGVSLMATSALTRFLLRAVAIRRRGMQARPAGRDDGGRRARLIGLTAATVLAVAAQVLIFGIHWALALLAVPIAFALAMVASRVAGETGIPPIGAIGKISQLSTGLMSPGDLTANLIGANVAGGAAGQSADLLNDFKAGHLVGTPPQPQVAAQLFGILTGSVVGSLVYLKLIPDPAHMLITEEWPAPAVATWKVVAETLSRGLDSIPPSALWAIALAGMVGIAAAIVEHRRGPRGLPSMPALGLAMAIPASLSLTMFAGSLIAKAMERWQPTLAQRFVIAGASGLIAGESLAGVGKALLGVLG